MAEISMDEDPSSRSSSVELLAHRRTGPPPFDTPADFVIQTPQETHWHVSAAILGFASPFFREMSKDPPSPGQPFVFAIPESDALLETLLRFAYPVADPALYDLDDITDALAAAQKYQFAAAAQALERMLLAPRVIASEPVRVYAIAQRLGLDGAADAAAFHACATAPVHWPFCVELADISAAQYHALLAYHRRRAALALQALHAHDLAGPCAACGKSWAKKFRSKAARALRDAPADLCVFEVGFVARLARELKCKECSHSMLQALRPEGSLPKLKAIVERLPLSVLEAESSDNWS